MSVFDKIKTGLEEAIAYEKGELDFAQYMGVSVKTVEAWEAGRNHPEGAACRLLALTKKDPQFPIKTGIVAR